MENFALFEMISNLDNYQRFEIISGVVILLILLADLALVIKRPHVPSMKEATAWVSFYITLALIFAGVLFFLDTPGETTRGQEFLAGWLTEYSLSIDNLFVFVLIMTNFKVPKKYQQQVLMIGIIFALICRGVFILAGAIIIEQFVGVFYIFGAFLLYTAYKQAFGQEHDAGEDTAVVKMLRKRINLTSDYYDNKLRVNIDGKRYWTPMLIVLIAIGTTDVMFALDSIPAIFGITQDAFLVFTANVFALMGLRQLYFLLGGLLDKLIYLKYGIAAILGFIGVKLILHAGHETLGEFGSKLPEINTWFSLGVIVTCMVVSAVASICAIVAERLREITVIKEQVADLETRVQASETGQAVPASPESGVMHDSAASDAASTAHGPHAPHA